MFYKLLFPGFFGPDFGLARTGTGGDLGATGGAHFPAGLLRGLVRRGRLSGMNLSPAGLLSLPQAGQAGRGKFALLPGPAGAETSPPSNSASFSFRA